MLMPKLQINCVADEIIYAEVDSASLNSKPGVWPPCEALILNYTFERLLDTWRIKIAYLKENSSNVNYTALVHIKITIQTPAMEKKLRLLLPACLTDIALLKVIFAEDIFKPWIKPTSWIMRIVQKLFIVQFLEMTREITLNGIIQLIAVCSLS